MDLTEINESLKEDEATRMKFRGEGALRTLSKTVGMGVDLIALLCAPHLQL